MCRQTAGARTIMDDRFDLQMFRARYRSQIDANACVVADLVFDVKDEMDADEKLRRMTFFCTLTRYLFPHLSVDSARALYMDLRGCDTREEAMSRLRAVPCTV